MPPPSLLTHLTHPFIRSPLSKNRYTIISFSICSYFNHQHLSVLASREGTITVVWSLHNWLVCQGFSCSDSRLLKVSGSGWTHGGYLENRQENCWKSPPDFFIHHRLIFILIFILRVVVEDWYCWFLPLLIPSLILLKGWLYLPRELSYLVRKQSHPERHYWGRMGGRTLREWVCIEEVFCAR